MARMTPSVMASSRSMKAVSLSAAALETLHSQAYSIFRGAITDTLHDALDPEPIL